MALIGVKLDISMLPVTLNFLPRTVFLFYSGASSVEFGFNKKRNVEFSKTTEWGHKPALPHIIHTGSFRLSSRGRTGIHRQKK